MIREIRLPDAIVSCATALELTHDSSAWNEPLPILLEHYVTGTGARTPWKVVDLLML